ncbi:magnesium transporter [Rhodovibrionaceae bacterium A322]
MVDPLDPYSQQPESEPTSEEVAGLEHDLMDQVVDALDNRDFETVTDLAESLHPADMADLLEGLDSDHRSLLLDIVAFAMDPEVLTHLESSYREEVAEKLGPKAVARIIEALESDDALEIFEDLSEDLSVQVLSRIPRTYQRFILEGLEFPEDSAGRLMQREVMVVPALWSVGETIDYMRSNKRKIQSDFYDLYLVDPRYKPVGKLPLSRVLRNSRPTALADIMDEDHYSIPVNMDQEEVAYLFKQYDLISAPVVDSAGRLLGLITIDDVVHVVEEEAQEDFFKLSGVGEDDLYSAALETAKSRSLWLFVNLLTAVLASLVIGLFTDTLEKVVALAVLMPIVASMGGNAGTQSLSVAVRAIAMKNLAGTATQRFITKEVVVGLVNGVIFAAVIGVVTWVWFSSTILALVIGAAMVINMLVAGAFGALIPIVLDRMKVDPAVSSSVFLTTVTDVVGFFAFLGLASIFLL